MTYKNDKIRKQKKDESRKKYNEKNPNMVNYCAKKHYWKEWFDEDYIKSLYNSYGDYAFEILKKLKKEHKNRIKEQQQKDFNKLLLKSLKEIKI
jgi:hypothetical protein